MMLFILLSYAYIITKATTTTFILTCHHIIGYNENYCFFHLTFLSFLFLVYNSYCITHKMFNLKGFWKYYMKWKVIHVDDLLLYKYVSHSYARYLFHHHFISVFFSVINNIAIYWLYESLVQNNTNFIDNFVDWYQIYICSSNKMKYCSISQM